ncbi:NAD-dependent epimerase/dehydratase family protein, partial [Patescibacteria group bacterium]
QDNLVGTFNVLEAIRETKADPILIYSSTNKVYGGMTEVKTREVNGQYQYVDFPNGIPEDRFLDFHSPYGCSKGAADQYVRDYARMYGMRTVVFRQSCIYGCRQFGVEDQGWVAWFTIASMFDKPITIYGDGKQVRDVLFVGDLLNAFDLAIQNIDRTAGEIYNIGGGPKNQLSLLELIDLLEKFFKKKISYSFADWRPGDQPVFVCDIRKALKSFGWTPVINVQSGIEKLSKWVSKNRDLFPDLGIY